MSSMGDKAAQAVHTVKEKLPGTTEHKLAQGEAGYTGTTAGAGTGYTGQVNGTTGVTGEHHGHHHGHHGHSHGHHASGAAVGTGATTDTHRESTYEGVAKHVPGTDAHGVHQANQGTLGGSGTGTHTGHHHHNAGNVGAAGVGAATDGNFGSGVDTHNQTAAEGVKKHVPGTDAHDVHTANKEAGRGDGAGSYGVGHGVSGVAGQATGGALGSTVDTPHETTKEKITKHIPGTEANKVHKANKDQGTV